MTTTTTDTAHKVLCRICRREIRWCQRWDCTKATSHRGPACSWCYIEYPDK